MVFVKIMSRRLHLDSYFVLEMFLITVMRACTETPCVDLNRWTLVSAALQRWLQKLRDILWLSSPPNSEWESPCRRSRMLSPKGRWWATIELVRVRDTGPSCLLSELYKSIGISIADYGSCWRPCMVVFWIIAFKLNKWIMTISAFFGAWLDVVIISGTTYRG